MKILITTLNSKFIHTSLSIRYLKSFAKDDFPNIELEEYTINQSIDYIVGDIYKKEIDVVAFSCYIWNIEHILHISEVLKLVRPNLKIILGGPEVSFDGEDLIKNNTFIDYIIYGEGEETFKELLLELKNEKDDLRNVKGLIFRKGEEVFTNEPRPLIQDLDIIPSPFDDDLENFKNKIVYFESSRGCPFNCRFCLSSTIKGVRFFSIERVKKDLKKLIDANVKQVKFVDRTFNARKEYALEIMNFIIGQNPNNINFHFEVTAHLLDDEVLSFLKNVPEGLFQFEIGVQSTNPQTLEAIDRVTNIEKLMDVVKRIKSYNNIHQHLDLIAGLPYEDLNSFKNSFNDIYSLRPEKLQLGFLKLLKGSELRNKKDKYGYKFIAKPPYEVLESNFINYREMLKLKAVEDLVEKYANELYFENSLNYIIRYFYQKPYDFFESFAEYWDKNELSNKAHSRTDLYKILLEFYSKNIGEHILLFRDILRFDFVYNTKSPTIPHFMKNTNEDISKAKKHDFFKKQSNLEKYIPEYLNIPTKKIINEVYIEKFNYDILEIIEKSYNLDMVNTLDTYILFVYNNDRKVFERCKYFNITEEFLHEE